MGHGSTQRGTFGVREFSRRDVAEIVLDTIGFEPYPEQWPILLAPEQFLLLTGGEQGGKSEMATKCWLLNWLEDQSKWAERKAGDGYGPPLIYWLVAEDYGGTRREFEYIQRDVELLTGRAANATKRIDPGVIEYRVQAEGGHLEPRPRFRIETKSARDPRRLRMVSPHGIIMCEAATMDYETYLRCFGRVGPTDGWLVLAGTLEEDCPWFPQVADAWALEQDKAVFELPSWTNRSAYPGGRDDPKIKRIEAEASDDWFIERIAGKRVPPKGLVLPEFNSQWHVQDVEWTPGVPIHLWEDPGYGGQSVHAVEAAQVIDGQVRVVDEIYEQGLITPEIIDVARSRPWWTEGVKWLVSDPHYKDQHHSNTSVGEIWMAETGLYAAGERGRINDGTERFKSFLKIDPITKRPRIVFSSTRCPGILSELGARANPITNKMQVYRWQLDREGNHVGPTPIDRFNHGIKAVMYGLVENFGYTRGQRGGKILVKRW